MFTCIRNALHPCQLNSNVLQIELHIGKIRQVLDLLDG